MSELRHVPADWISSTEWRGRVLEWLERRTVALVIGVPRGIDGTKSGTHVRTAFLYARGKRLFLVTAGHVLNEMRGLMARPGSDHCVVRIYDKFQDAAADFVPIEWSRCVAHIEDTHERDLAVLELDEHTSDLLRKNRELRVLGPADVIDHADADRPQAGTFCVVVGYPIQWLDQSATELPAGIACAFKTESVAVPIRVALAPDEIDRTVAFYQFTSSFYFKCGLTSKEGERPLDRLEGLSGGPLLVVFRAEDGTLTDRLIGVQAGWDSASGVARAEAFEPVKRFIAGKLRRRSDPVK